MSALMHVCDHFAEGNDGTGHQSGIECPCCPSTLTDGRGGFYVCHRDFTERTIER